MPFRRDRACAKRSRWELENAVTCVAGIPGFQKDPFATLEWGGAKRFRLAHFLYLDVSGSAGASLFETLPSDFQFSMDGLRAFPLPPHGHREIYGRAELSLPPLARDAGYAVFNLTRVEDVVASVHVQGGRTWGGCDLVCESGVRVEAGGSLTFVVDGFLGSSFELSVGYAHPLLGLDGEASIFVDFDVPF